MILSERSSLATQTGFAVFRNLVPSSIKKLEAFPLGLAIVRIAKNFTENSYDQRPCLKRTRKFLAKYL